MDALRLLIGWRNQHIVGLPRRHRKLTATTSQTPRIEKTSARNTKVLTGDLRKLPVGVRRSQAGIEEIFSTGSEVAGRD
ncbi:MAG: hypothetical protein GY820_16000 [Gammaproteobacteria bacterium]|nr:hypothetical protein [Gammaproteobacteria bacterium]